MARIIISFSIGFILGAWCGIVLIAALIVGRNK